MRSGATPNRTAVATIIGNFRRTDSSAPVTLACQKNFGMLFTDGFSDSPAENDGIQGCMATSTVGKAPSIQRHLLRFARRRGHGRVHPTAANRRELSGRQSHGARWLRHWNVLRARSIAIAICI